MVRPSQSVLASFMLAIALTCACSSDGTVDGDGAAGGGAGEQPTLRPIVVPLQSPLFYLPAGSNAVVGSSFGGQILLMGGEPPYSVTLAPGSTLPAGLSLNSDGVIVGTPSEEGNYAFEIEVADSTGSSYTTGFTSFVVGTGPAPPFIVGVVPLPAFGQGQEIGYRPLAWGSGYPWSFSVDGLPDGVTLDPDTGTLSGTSNLTGSWDLSYSATDADGASAMGSPASVTLGVFEAQPPPSGETETWVIFRPDGAEAAVTVRGGAISQISGQEWQVFDNTGDCSFPVVLSGQVVGDQWQFTGNGAGCNGFQTQCFAQGQAGAPGEASGPLQCTNRVPGDDAITNEGTWTAQRQ